MSNISKTIDDKVISIANIKIKELDTLHTFSSLEKSILEKVTPYFILYDEKIIIRTSVDFDENRTLIFDIKKYHNLEEYEYITYDIELNNNNIYYHNVFFFKKYKDSILEDRYEDKDLSVDEFIVHFTDKFLS